MPASLAGSTAKLSASIVPASLAGSTAKLSALIVPYHLVALGVHTTGASLLWIFLYPYTKKLSF